MDEDALNIVAEPGGGPSTEKAGRPLLSTRVLVHIGMHKTGTSWLQEHLFGADDTPFFSLGDRNLPAKLRAKAHASAFFADDKGRLLPDEEFDAERVRNRIAPLRVPEASCAVMSNERLSGHPLSNGIDRRSICRRIRQVFPDARVLIVIREQRSAIASHYIQHLRYGGGYTLKDFIDSERKFVTPHLTFHYFKYDRLIRLYLSEFGPENVLVLPYEMLVSSPAEFIERICDFSGVEMPSGLPFETKSNERLDQFSLMFFRRVAPLIRSSRANGYAPTLLGPELGRKMHVSLVRALGTVVPRSWDKRAKDALKQQVAELAGDTYAASNRGTERLIGIDLGALGYVM